MNDHNFKVVMTTLEVIQRVVELEVYRDGDCLLERLVQRMWDPKAAIRTLVGAIMATYLSRVGVRAQRLLKALLADSSRRNGKEELLELLMELCERSPALISENLELVLCELCLYMETQKVRGRTLDVMCRVCGSSKHAIGVVTSQIGAQYLPLFQDMIGALNSPSKYKSSPQQKVIQQPQKFEISTASSSRSEVTSLANRLKSKGD